MQRVVSPAGMLADGQAELLARSGTAWRADESNLELLGAVAEARDQQLAETRVGLASAIQRHVIDRSADLHPLAYRYVVLDRPSFVNQAGEQVIELPHAVQRVDAVKIKDVIYESLLDYRQHGNYLVFSGKLPPCSEIECYNLSLHRGHVSRFWGSVFNYHDAEPGAERFYLALHNLQQTTCSPASFAELLGACFDVPTVTRPGTVVEVVHRARYGPVIVTDQETIVGRPSDIALVEPGQSVEIGQFVFDSLRLHDFQYRPPVWLSSLTIPPNYFSGQITGPLTFSSAPQVAAGVTIGTAGLHVKIPCSGLAADRQAFHDQFVASELLQRSTLANFIDGAETEAGWLSRERNWLEVLWSIWLRGGVSVSVVRDRPTGLQLRRYGQLRRAVPPWTSHLVQFLQPPEQYNEFC
mgnify:CR=1 FL=1